MRVVGLHKSRHVLPVSSGLELHAGVNGNGLSLFIDADDDGGDESECDGKKTKQGIVRPP